MLAAQSEAQSSLLAPSSQPSAPAPAPVDALLEDVPLGVGAPAPTDVPVEVSSAPTPAPSAADAAPGSGGNRDDRADALAAADCPRVGWYVERIRSSKAMPLLPADLAGAQLALRQRRRASGK